MYIMGKNVHMVTIMDSVKIIAMDIATKIKFNQILVIIVMGIHITIHIVKLMYTLARIIKETILSLICIQKEIKLRKPTKTRNV